MCYGLLRSVTWLVDRRDMTHLEVWRDCGHDWVSCIQMSEACLYIYECDVTHSYIWDMTQLVERCDVTVDVGVDALCRGMTHWVMWYDVLRSVTWLVDRRDMTHLEMWHDAFVTWRLPRYDSLSGVIWLVEKCDVTRWSAWHDSFRDVTWRIRDVTFDMTSWEVWHDCWCWCGCLVPRYDSLSDVIWRVEKCDVTRWSAWHDSFRDVTWLIRIYETWLIYTLFIQIIGVICTSHRCDMGLLRLVGFLKAYVSFAEYRLFYRALLQKRPIILRSLLIEVTPYDVLRSVTWLIERRDMTVWEMCLYNAHCNTLCNAHCNTHCNTWGIRVVETLIEKCDMTHWEEWHGSLRDVSWLIEPCEKTHWAMRRDSFRGVAWLMTWLTERWDMTHWEEWHCSLRSVTWLIKLVGSVSWLIERRDMTQWEMWHGSYSRLKSATWRIDRCDMTQGEIWHD